MPTPDELLAMVNQILNQVQDDSAALGPWSRTEEGRQVIQFIVQVGKYNTTVGQGQDISIGDCLNWPLLEEVRDLLRSQLPPPLEIDWHQVSRSLLNEQIQRLTTNPLTHAEGIAYRTEQVYVPLGLVERKKVSRRREDVSPEQGSLLYEETEITQKFEQGVFLEQVLRRGQSPRSRGRRIAVIGEPGAGKTTLLQQIARWVAENIEGAISIWVSLADLQGRSLENYLLKQWLPAMVQQQGQAEASTQVQDALVAQFQQGRVWILLDGVDEMLVTAGTPLSEIERQVRLGGLLAQARIVLTCRLNLWDGDRHALDTFDVYRTLEFAYPGQVEQFIGQWFGALPEAQKVQAERLCKALRQPGKERLRDLVKNPLRLTLLCFNWYLGAGTLPETKAGLYEQFVADFYEWKRERFPKTAVQRERLNAALGELAREAIDKEETRFRLRHDFVCHFLGEPNEEGSLFKLALNLGWLNKIGVAEENRRQAVYAFFHPTFQEYFASLAIDNWHFFLNHISKSPLHSETSYRIFELPWKEPYLLWLGRQNVLKKCKEELIKALVEFEEKIEPRFYQHKALFLAASGIGEFQESSLSSYIVPKLILTGLTFSSPEKSLFYLIFGFDAEFKKAMLETRRDILVKCLARMLELPGDNFPHLRTAFILGEIDPGNPVATSTLVDEFQGSDNNFKRETIAEAIGKVCKGNQTVIKTLIKLIQQTQDVNFCCDAASALAEIDSSNQLTFEALTCIIENSVESHLPLKSIQKLGTLSEPLKSEKVIPFIINLIKNGLSEAREQSAKTLGKIDQGNPQAVSALLDLIYSSTDDFSRLVFIESLMWVDKFNPVISSYSLRLIKATQDKEIVRRSAEVLGRYDNHQQFAVSLLIDLIEQSKNEDDYNLPWLSDKRRFVRWKAVISLGEVGYKNISALKALVSLVQTTSNPTTRIYAIQALGKLRISNRDSIDTLLDFIKHSEKDYEYKMALESLESTLDKSQIPDIIGGLKGYLSNQIFENEFIKFKDFYGFFWRSLDKTTYSKFCQNWQANSHLKTKPFDFNDIAILFDL